MNIIILALIGMVSGLVMGGLGVGGGAIIVFSLMYIAKFPQTLAQGTTLLIIAAPVSILAAWKYHQNGLVDIKAGLLIMLFFLIFSYIGAQFAHTLPKDILKYALGSIFLLMGLKILFF